MKMYRYLTKDGAPMQIEVPLDQQMPVLWARPSWGVTYRNTPQTKPGMPSGR